DEHKHDYAVQRVTDEDRVAELGEAGWLGGVDVNSDETPDGQKRASDCEHTLRPCGRMPLTGVLPQEIDLTCGVSAGRAHAVDGRRLIREGHTTQAPGLSDSSVTTINAARRAAAPRGRA